MIHVIAGPPCSGKSTHTREHAQPGDTIVDTDALAFALGHTESHGATGAIKRAAYAAREAAIVDALNHPDDDAWIIHTDPTSAHIERYSAAGASLTVLDPGIDVCLARAEAEDRPDGTADTIRAWYARRTQEKGSTVANTKDLRVAIKAVGEADGLLEGQFRALVSVFGNIDSYGDIVEPGAFTDSLAAWAAKGSPIPLVWSHDWTDPFSHIGVVDQAEETDEGLLVLATVDMDNPKAAQIYRLLKGRRVTKFSFAYETIESEIVTRDEVIVRLLKRLDILEVGPCLIGANSATDLLDIKALDTLSTQVKEGRVLAAKHLDNLRTARDMLAAVITAAEATTDDGGKSSAEPSTSTGQPTPETANASDAASSKSSASGDGDGTAQAEALLTLLAI